ncbi:carbamoyltransferase [Flavisolibacter sp. BT320]|nr:carbamoyltransferase [Flavisolibacter longurius]
MVILGINAYHADASAAIFVNGRLVAASEEERFRRVKHWAGFPATAIAFCLKEAGVSFEQVDYFAIGRDPKAKFLKKLLFLAANPIGSTAAVKQRFANAKKVASIEEDLAAISGLAARSFTARIRNVEHHRSHMASAFFASPFEEAALLSIDGSGDFTTTMIGVGRGAKMEVLDSIDFPHSLGIFYSAFTQLLGFPHYGDEYKVMGMAPYGKPKYTRELEEVIRRTPDGLFRLNLDYFRSATQGIISYNQKNVPVVAPLYSKAMAARFGPPRKKDEPLEQRHKDLAASVQKVTENVIFHVLTHLQKRTGLENVCIAGGVAQNSVANGKITLATPFKNLYIPSAGHDAGISLGAALYVQHQELHTPRQASIRSAFTGSRFSNTEIKAILTRKGIPFSELSDATLYEKTAACLQAGGVVGWFSGRAEFGPRALGGRSILADPRRADAKELLNHKIKRRESFRPFAPSILKEFVADFFELTEDVPFMEKVFPIKKEQRARVPAVTHVDGTGRLQTVDKKISPRYHALIQTFYRQTGIPILLNTSFNENEPIVNTPEEALSCYLRTAMDMLVMENIVVERGEQAPVRE